MTIDSDGFRAILVGLSDLVVLAGVGRFANRGWPGAPVAVRISAGLVTFWGLIVGCALPLGGVGHLEPRNLYSFVLMVSVGFLLLDPPSTRHAVESASAPRGFGPSAARAGLLLIGVAYLVHVAVYGIYPLPTDWDSMAYHIPIVDGWVRHGHLCSRDAACWFFPGNSELLAFWFAAPFSGDFWINLNNLPVVGLLAVSTYALSQVLGLSPAGRCAARTWSAP